MGVSLDIIIVGAGLGGLAAALALSSQNHRVTVLESSTRVGEIGAGIQVTPNFTRILHRWGLSEPLAKYGVLPQMVTQLRWENGKELTHFSLNRDDQMEKAFGYPYYHIHRMDLHNMLLDKARENGAVIKTGCVVAEYAHLTEGGHNGMKEQVILNDGRTFRAHLIIAADGSKSALNQFVTGAKTKAQPTGDSAYRALLTREQVQELALDSLPIEKGATVWLGPDRHVVGYYVCAGRLYNLVIIVPDGEVDEESWRLPGDMKKLRAQFEGWDSRLQKMLAQIEQSYVWSLRDRGALDRWLHPVGAMVLLGDAAHPMLPYVAQGAASAIEDAAALAECLKFVSEERPLRSVLAEYEKIRIPRTFAMREAGRKNQKYFHLLDGEEQQSRDAALAAEAETGETPNQLNDQSALKDMYGYDVVSKVQKIFQT